MSDDRDLHLGIDATNIRQGGGITHLSQLLQAADPRAAGFRRVTIWSAASTAAAWPQRGWLTKRSARWMEASLPRRIAGQQFQIPAAVRAEGCDVLFAPGGTLPARCLVPMITMSQNMLPFESIEADRFGRWSTMRLKLHLLRQAQGRSFRRADGVVFLTRYAESTITRALGSVPGATAQIPHGIEGRFIHAPREQRPLASCTPDAPFRLLYVSILMPYKHQVEVAVAVARLRADGVPIEIRFVGEPWGAYGRHFGALLAQLDPRREFLHWNGAEPFASLHGLYRAADAFVFASSCENLPNILLEAMAAGLPIACADRGPMPEVLGDAGVYFDPTDPASIADSLRHLMQNAALRAELAAAGWKRATTFSWQRCARDTFEFIAQVTRSRRTAAPPFSSATT